jgi:hypothetical protein
MAPVNMSIITSVVISAVFVILSVIISAAFGCCITRPLKKVSKEMELVCAIFNVFLTLSDCKYGFA